MGPLQVGLIRGAVKLVCPVGKVWNRISTINQPDLGGFRRVREFPQHVIDMVDKDLPDFST